MKFSLAAAAAFLAADSAFAARMTEKRWAAHAKRALTLTESRSSGLLNRTQENEETSTNWAGSVVKTTGVTSVTGTFTVPSVSLPEGANSYELYGATAWVGIDGDTGTNSILQTGVDFLAEGGQTGYEAWFEWYPAASHTFSMDVNAGDVITVTVTATSSTSGSAVIENHSTGQSVTHSFHDQSVALSQVYAEWIVEDFEYGSSLIPFAEFGSVTFTDSSAQTSQGTVGPAQGTVMDIKQDGQMLTSSSIDGNSLTVKYV
ncbi:hypothetical protein TD95_002733 [Thielaviopsis punctulata]|uniref:Aspergillopepsin-2 n=1 Tax=Thielaviopsis punctulata TaxID=72032 RepID=A0A0F4ZKW4_9PEZI|nr:hypothetical protein TD95_002733 [Thielaviopsis punctulata]